MSIHDDPPREGTPTPIDPADIRPGDVVERRDRFTICQRTPNYLVTDQGGYLDHRDAPEGVERTYRLVHRPDPDAEAVEALARFLHDDSGCLDPFGTCVSTSENYRSQARRIVEFQRQNGQEHA